MTERDVGKNIQSTSMDFAVCYAIQGNDYVNATFTNVQYTVLQAALILTITFPLFINPFELSSDDSNRAFSALIGFSAVSHIGCIIALTIIVSYVNRAYTATEHFVQLLTVRPIFVISIILNYLADCAAMACLMLVGMDRSNIDGGIIISMGIFMSLSLLIVFSYIFANGSLHQDERVFMFYQKYCESNGELKKEYITKIYN